MVMIDCQLELETVSGEGCAPEIPVKSRRESKMIELTTHPWWSYSTNAELYGHVTK